LASYLSCHIGIFHHCQYLQINTAHRVIHKRVDWCKRQSLNFIKSVQILFDIFFITALGHVPTSDCIYTLIIGVSNAVDIVNDFRKIFHLFWDICWYSYLLFRRLLDDMLAFRNNSTLGSNGSFELGLLLLNNHLTLILLLRVKSLDLIIISLNINNVFTHSLSFTFSSGCWTPNSNTCHVLRDHVT